MNFSFGFQRPQRDSKKSVLFWALSLVESQRQKSNPTETAAAITAVPQQEEVHVLTDVEREKKRTRRDQATPQVEAEVLEQVHEQQVVEEIEETQEVEVEGGVVEQVPCSVSYSTATVAAPTQPHDRYRFKDVLAVSESLLGGLLGPVAVDVELNGSTSLLREPERFAASLLAMEQASSSVLRNFHASIQLFFALRGESYYTLRAPAAYTGNSNTSTVCSPVVFLAKLLSTPAVMKIILHASYLYRLLFLFLGTDRVSVSNVVDVTVWSTVTGRLCGQHQRTPPCTNIQQLWECISLSAQEHIALVLQNAELVAQYDSTLWKGISKEITTTTTTTSTDIAVGEDERHTTASEAVSPLASSLCVEELPLLQLTERLKSLSALYAYYEAYLQALKSTGAAGTIFMSVATVCDVETRVCFLCELMSYHGMLVNRRLLDSMLLDLDQQVKSLTCEGNEALQALQTSLAAKQNERDAEGVAPAIVGVGEVDIGSITSGELVKLLHQKYRCVLNVNDSYERQLQQLCTYMYHQGCVKGNVAYIWLAIHERREFRRSLMDGFTKGTNIHARIISTPEEDEERELNNKNKNNTNDGMLKRSLFFSVHPKWAVHHSTTARLYCSKPNLQTLSKKPVLCRTPLPTATATTLFSNPAWTPRHVYGAPPGCTLISFDFNQIELRLFAHLSRDELLIQQLRSGRDVLSEIARQLLGLQQIEDVTPYMRQAVKVVVYGMLYGMGVEAMDQRVQQLQQQASIDTGTTSALSVRQFLRVFQEKYPAGHAFLKNTRTTAFHEKRCVTLNGVRDLSSELDGNRRKQVAIALAIQGGAAVVLHHGMIAVHEKRHSFLPHFPAAAVALVMCVHDELVYVVPDAGVSVVAPQIKQVLEEQSAVLSLRVPLPVSVQAGKSLGEMEPLMPSL